MIISKESVKDFTFQSSYLVSFLASWLAVEVILSMYSWWYRYDPIGSQVITIFIWSLPLYLVALILRKVASPKVKMPIIVKYGDVIISILGVIVILLPILNDVMSLVLLGIVVLSPIIVHPVVEFMNLKRGIVYLLNPIFALLIVVLIYLLIN